MIFRRKMSHNSASRKSNGVKFALLTMTGGRNCSFWLWCRTKSMSPTIRKIPTSHQIHPGSRRRDCRRYSGARLLISPPCALPQSLSLKQFNPRTPQANLTAVAPNPRPWTVTRTTRKAPSLRRARGSDGSGTDEHPAAHPTEAARAADSAPAEDHPEQIGQALREASSLRERPERLLLLVGGW